MGARSLPGCQWFASTQTKRVDTKTIGLQPCDGIQHPSWVVHKHRALKLNFMNGLPGVFLVGSKLEKSL